ncbi:MAG: ribosome biogenesis GTP-binding protein YihA/YsxC [Deltaproteobacteria bacterium]|nr:ribosome biogenesis GTP-binding protein YihA/YsxC [Deltaproteobacteria bacterium]
MKIKGAVFELSAVEPSTMPNDGLPEIAFAGRSNVGKSSLINTILGRKRLAITSSTPGKTRTVNFYLVNEAFRLVDLPGYGYAEVSKAERESWRRMIEMYFTERETLSLVISIIDIRRDIGDLEETLYAWLAKLDIPFAVVVTKCDKLSKNAAASRLAAIKRALRGTEPIAFSATTGFGKDKVLGLIKEAIERLQ